MNYFNFAGCEQGQNCYSTAESQKGGPTNRTCCSMECDISESNESSPIGSSESRTNANGCCCQIDSEKKSCCRPSKVNDSSAGGLLRYALHLHFLSPLFQEIIKIDAADQTWHVIRTTQSEYRYRGREAILSLQ